MIDSNRLIEALNNIARAIELNVETFQNIQKPDVTQDEDLPKPETLELNEVRGNRLKDPPNPMQAELYAVKDERYRTYEQLNKMTDFVELLITQIVKLTSSANK